MIILLSQGVQKEKLKYGIGDKDYAWIPKLFVLVRYMSCLKYQIQENY